MHACGMLVAACFMLHVASVLLHAGGMLPYVACCTLHALLRLLDMHCVAAGACEHCIRYSAPTSGGESRGGRLGGAQRHEPHLGDVTPQKGALCFVGFAARNADRDTRAGSAVCSGSRLCESVGLL